MENATDSIKKPKAAEEYREAQRIIQLPGTAAVAAVEMITWSVVKFQKLTPA